MENKYQITLEKEQLEVISKALDLFARVQMGQVSELTNPYLIPLPDADYSDVETKIIELKKAMFPNLPEKSYYSIKSKYISDTIRQAVDIYEVIRHQLAMDSYEPPIDDPEHKPDGAMYKNPFHWSSELDLPKIEKIGEQDDTTNNNTTN